MQHILPHDSHKVPPLQADGVLIGFPIRNILPALVLERPIDLHNDALFHEKLHPPDKPLDFAQRFMSSAIAQTLPQPLQRKPHYMNRYSAFTDILRCSALFREKRVFG